MSSRRIEGLPNLPGNSYVDPTLIDFRKSHTFECVNGFMGPKRNYLGIGSCPIPETALTIKDLFDTYNYDPTLTYGKPKPKPPPPVIPAFVALEKKVLKFTAYYKEAVHGTSWMIPTENFRVRPVDILFYLEDDSIMVREPLVPNSGLMQGTFLKRHRIPKNDIGEYWHWKDLNLRCDVMFYGRAFRIVDADNWTKAFYESEGVIMADPEILPKDPYIDKRFLTLQKQIYCQPMVMTNARKKFIEFDKRVLKFHCVWDDRHTEYGSLRKMDLLYHLCDDCVEVKEILEPNCGRDPCALLLHKVRLPKMYKDLPADFPSGSMQPSEHEIVEYYEPKDFKIGATINVYGRRFLIYDIDECTKQYYREHFGYTDFQAICVFPKKPPRPPIEPPPWNGWGTPEDSLQSWLHIVPRPPRYDAMKRLVFELKVLKFGAVMDSTRPEDQGREFTISYRLVDDKIAVYERPVRNSGWPGGKFLDFCLLQKAGSSNDKPEYYAPHDLYIGAMLDVYGHRFCLNSADPFVLEFVEKNPDCFPEHVKCNLREYFECEKKVNPERFDEKPCDPGKPVCEEPIGEGFFEYLGYGGQKIDEDPCRDNPNPCPMPYDWNICRTLGYNCGQEQPEHKGGELEPIDQICEKPCPGNPDMFENKECAVCQPHRYVPPEPIMKNPLREEEPECIPTEAYYPLKERRFDCYNPPTEEQLAEINEKRLRFHCPCDPCAPPADDNKKPFICCPAENQKDN